MIGPTARMICLVLTVACFLCPCQADDWPQWRGPDRADVSNEKGLLTEWPDGGPAALWLFQETGAGYAGPAVVGDRLYIMGSGETKEVLIALATDSGRRVWTADIGAKYHNSWGDGPRGTPTVEDGRVYAMGGQGDLVCADATNGKVLWRASMTALGGSSPMWGYAASVLLDGNRVICTPGGDRGAVAALDKTDGHLIWQSKAFTEAAQYSSPVLAEINGVKQIVQLTMKKLVGIEAETGKVLWQSDWPGKTAVIPTPICKDNYVFVTSGYGVGCQLIAIGPDNSVKKVYANADMSNHHGGVLRVGDYLYGYSDRKGWVCMDFMTGKILWADKSLGKGAVTCAGGMLYCLAENSGGMALVSPSPTGWTAKGTLTLTPQSTRRSRRGKIWTHPVIADGRLFLRDQEIVYCYNVKGR